MTQDNNLPKTSPSPGRGNYLNNSAEFFRPSSNKWPKLRAIVLVIALAATVGVIIYKHDHQRVLSGPQSVNQVVKEVSRHLVLPAGEQPTLATVSDVNKVKGQPFFAHAANGDKVLIYAKAKKAILYRPSIDRILEIAPLTTGTNQ